MPVTASVLGAQAILGGIQAFGSGRKDRENELNDFAKASPLYKGSKSVNDYYQEALNRYNENPYQSAFYQQAKQNAARLGASGINALQDRRSAIGGIGRLAGIQNDALQRAGVQAEEYKNQQFRNLGQAAQAKAGEDYKMFDINQMTPFNRQLQLKQYAAQAANDRYNAGMQMLGSAASNAAMVGATGGFKGLFKNKTVTPTETTPNLTNVNVPGSPLGKFAALNLNKFGLNTGGFNSVFNKNYGVNTSYLPKSNTNTYNVDEYFSPNY